MPLGFYILFAAAATTPTTVQAGTHGPHTASMAAASTQRGIGGRKKRVDLWTHFTYNPTEKKTQCIVVTGDTPCGHKLGGRIPQT